MTRYLPMMLLIPSLAMGAPKQKPKAEQPATVDVKEIKDKLTVWSDGKKHYVAMVMTTNSDSPIFWSSDGKSFYELRVRGGGSEGDDANLVRLDRSFWEPRVESGYQASLDYKKDEGKLTVQCLERKTPLGKLDDAEAKKIVAGAQFYKARWNRYAYALMRDDRGKYYYVDNQREPENAKNFHVYAGPKGSMKLQKLLNVVSDSQGDIFSTPGGQLRLIIAKQDSTWIANEKPTKLVWVPVEDNHVLIYTDLGPYTGEPLGTPCDDL